MGEHDAISGADIMTEKILIVDDEKDLVRIVQYNLEEAGFRTAVAYAGEEALRKVRDEAPDLVVLDLMLPDLSGVEVCRRMRRDEATRRIPVLMLTAKGTELDRVVGFEVGADDYVVKPFSVRELVLRIQAILRRSADQEPAAVLNAGPISVDVPSCRVTVEGREVSLTALEFRLLVELLQKRGRVLSRDQLLDTVWGIEADIVTRTVDAHVKRLRDKLGPAADLVETVRGLGYRLRTE